MPGNKNLTAGVLLTKYVNVPKSLPAEQQVMVYGGYSRASSNVIIENLT